MLELYKIGNLAQSIAGHDKGEIYVIVKEESQYVYVADGVYKMAESPKRKNKKHIQPIHSSSASVSGLPDNQEMKRMIKLYKREAILCQSQM